MSLGFWLTTLVTALSLLLVDILFSGVYIESFLTAILAAIVLGLINSVLRPILFVLSLPINLLTLGLFSFVLNGICLWLAGVLVPGFQIHGLAAFLFGPIVLSLGTTFLTNYFEQRSLDGSTPGTEA